MNFRWFPLSIGTVVLLTSGYAASGDVPTQRTIPNNVQYPAGTIEGTTKFSIERGIAWFDGAVNGKRCRLSIDTGSETSLVDEAFAKELGLIPVKRADRFPSARLRELSADGCILLRDVHVEVVPRPLPKHVVLLGADLFRGKVVSIDFVTNSIHFGSSQSPAASDRELSSRPCLRALVGNAKCTFLSDLGSPFNVLSTQLLDELKNSDPDLDSKIRETPFSLTVGSLTGDEETAVMYLLPLVVNGEQMQTAFQVYPRPKGAPAILGLNFVRLFRSLTIDFGSHKLIFGPKLKSDEL